VVGLRCRYIEPTVWPAHFSDACAAYGSWFQEFGLGLQGSVSLNITGETPQPALESRNTVAASRSESGSINIHAIYYFFFFLLLVLLLLFLLRLLLNLLLLLLLPTWAH